jgi:tetratricopeptide (TPR) repeat protein
MRYARGYTELGLLNEAADELEAIEAGERDLPEVLAVRGEYHMAAKHWELLVGIARELTRADPENEQGWIYWAYALRELERVAEAKAVLVEAESLHGKTSATLHYNMACYHALLGELPFARARLETAFRMHPDFKQAALEDTDLQTLWGELLEGG